MTLNTITYRTNRSEPVYIRMGLTKVQNCQSALRCLYSRKGGNFHEFKMPVVLPPCISLRHSQNVAVPTSLDSIGTSPKFRRRSYTLYIRLPHPRAKKFSEVVTCRNLIDCHIYAFIVGRNVFQMPKYDG